MRLVNFFTNDTYTCMIFIDYPLPSLYVGVPVHYYIATLTYTMFIHSTVILTCINYFPPLYTAGHWREIFSVLNINHKLFCDWFIQYMFLKYSALFIVQCDFWLNQLIQNSAFWLTLALLILIACRITLNNFSPQMLHYFSVRIHQQPHKYL